MELTAELTARGILVPGEDGLGVVGAVLPTWALSALDDAYRMGRNAVLHDAAVDDCYTDVPEGVLPFPRTGGARSAEELMRAMPKNS